MQDVFENIIELKEQILDYERNKSNYLLPNSDYKEIEFIVRNNTTQFEEDLCFTSENLDIISSKLVRVLLIVLYCGTAALALFGNVGVIMVQLAFYRAPPLQNIRKYLINLALSDIVVGVLCVPFVNTDFILGRWVFPHWLCPLTHFAQLLSVFVTSNTLMIIGLERYSAIFFPLSKLHQFLRSKSYILLAFIWIFGCVYAYFPIGNANTDKYESKNGTEHFYQCNNYIGDTILETRFFMITNFGLTFALPMLVIMFTYTAIIKKLINISKSMIGRKYTFNKVVTFESTLAHPPQQQQQNSIVMADPTRSTLQHSDCTKRSRFVHNKNLSRYNKTINITLMIIVLYGVCWTPIKVFQLLHEFRLILYCTEPQYRTQLYMYISFHWLAMANSFVNPFVYTFASQRFRKDLRKFLKLLKF